MIKLSIIIPYYKTKELTDILLNNLKKQLTKEVEIILIDDGCNEDWEKYPIRVIKQNNSGVSVARNNGIKNAKGKYITFIDSDDNVADDYVSSIINKINTSEFDYCYLSWRAEGHPTIKDVIIKDNPPSWNTSIWNTIYKRSKIGMFSEMLQIGEDELFNKMYRKGKKEILDKVLYYYKVGRNESLTQKYSKKEITQERPIKASLILFQKFVSKIGGLETFIYEFIKQYYDTYDILFVYKEGDPKQIARYKKYIKCIKYANQKFECDKYLCVSNQDNIIDNVNSLENWYGMMIHADYEAMKWKYIPHKKTTINIAVSETAKKSILKQCPTLPCEVIYNLQDKPETKEPLILISATRLSWEKGKEKMYLLEDMLCKANIPHVWLVFTDNYEKWHKNMAFMESTLEVEHYIKMADYYITCSQTESWGYSTDLAFKLGVPVIATYYPALDEQGLIDGKNGFILNQDLSNAEEVINKMVNNNLKEKFNYEPKDNPKQWIKVLGNLKKPNNEWRDYNMKYLVKARFEFDDTTELDEKGVMIKRRPSGEAWIVDEARKDYLLEANAIMVVNEIPTDKKVEDTVEVDDNVNATVEDDLSKLTVKELKAMAKAEEVEGFEKMKKVELINALK